MTNSQFIDLDESWIDEAAEIAASSFSQGTSTYAKAHIETRRNRPNEHTVGLLADGMLVAVYGLSIGPEENELTFLAVSEQRRRLGYGRACLCNAIERSCAVPVILETDDDAVDFYRSCGFEIEDVWTPVHGRMRYRMRSGSR